MAELSLHDGCVRVTGAVDWQDCEPLRDAGTEAIAAADGMVEFDLSGIERPESRVLAVMLAWLRAAERHQRRLRFVAIPDAVTRIAEFTGVDEIFEEMCA